MHTVIFALEFLSMADKDINRGQGSVGGSPDLGPGSGGGTLVGVRLNISRGSSHHEKAQRDVVRLVTMLYLQPLTAMTF